MCARRSPRISRRTEGRWPRRWRSRRTPGVLLVLGVNGSGKTTTFGKLAAQLPGRGKQVLLAAGDTFRAAAIEQLARWGERTGVAVVKQGPGADPGGGRLRRRPRRPRRASADVLIVDTAGRLHTKTNLMAELEKISASSRAQIPGAPHETLLVLDATTGQNGIAQARVFNEALALTGLILTKLDGTAKGGDRRPRSRASSACRSSSSASANAPTTCAPFDPETFVGALVGV